ncbi:unnamed protein product [Rhizoctonia solani]|uniref:Uncharacterized protein n=1 Tax=Rhizoctonia solani TaxID=456999 RepID=A0A8H3BX79_9AGAM|nr:unnamed protein product [Rhizoctonia solani]
MASEIQEGLSEAESLFKLINQKDFAIEKKYVERIVPVVHALLDAGCHREVCLQSILALCQKLKIDPHHEWIQDTRFPKLGVNVLQSTLSHIPEDSNNSLLLILRELGYLHLNLFKLGGGVDNVNEAVDCHARIMSLNSIGLEGIHDELQKAAVWVANKRDTPNAIRNLQSALGCEHRALEIAPEESSIIPIIFNNLGYCYRLLFEHTKELCDIESSIEDLKKATSMVLVDYWVLPATSGWLIYIGLQRQENIENLS